MNAKKTAPEVRVAGPADLEAIAGGDDHITKKELARSIEAGRVYAAGAAGAPVAWMRYNLFWDNTPFMNLLWVGEEYRGLGLGKALVARWETDMQAAGYSWVLTSTQTDEDAQHFYRKLGYTEAGSLILPDQAMEIIFIKML